MTKDTWLQVRMDDEEKKCLEALTLRIPMNMSELVRAMVAYVYWHTEAFEAFLKKEE